MHLDIETDDVEVEAKRLEALGATRWDHQQERGFDFWVMCDPWSNEFCVLQTGLGLPALPAPRGRSGLRGQGQPAGLSRASAMRSTLGAGGAAS